MVSKAAFGVALGLLLQVDSAAAEHFSQTTSETRVVLYFKVSDEMLKSRLPKGWEPVTFDTSPARGANLTLNLSTVQAWLAKHPGPRSCLVIAAAGTARRPPGLFRKRCRSQTVGT